MKEIALDSLEAFLELETAASEAPKYLCLFGAFAKGIRSGLFEPGDRVPTEIELTRRLPVSLGTVQRALSLLAKNGLVVRRRRAGTFVADRRSQVGEVFVYRFTDPESGRVMLPFVRALSVSAGEAKGPWRDALGVERYVRLDRLVWFDQDPPAYSSLFFSCEHGRVFLERPIEELHGSASHRILIEEFNLPTLRIEHRISSGVLSGPACEHLLVPAGTSGIVWDIKDYSFQETPFLFQRYQLPPGHRPIEITEGRQEL